MLRGMELSHLTKNKNAIEELIVKGIAPNSRTPCEVLAPGTRQRECTGAAGDQRYVVKAPSRPRCFCRVVAIA